MAQSSDNSNQEYNITGRNIRRYKTKVLNYRRAEKEVRRYATKTILTHVPASWMECEHYLDFNPTIHYTGKEFPNHRPLKQGDTKFGYNCWTTVNEDDMHPLLEDVNTEKIEDITYNTVYSENIRAYMFPKYESVDKEGHRVFSRGFNRYIPPKEFQDTKLTTSWFEINVNNIHPTSVENY